MKISVITTSYNSGHTIGDTINSVLSQDYSNVEHIIVDAGSTDDTLEVLRRFQDKVKFVSEKDGGIYYGMNKGLAMSTGDVICFLNADDWYCGDDVLSKVVAKMKCSNCLVVYGDLAYVRQFNPERIVRTWRSGKFRRKNIYYGWMPPHPAFFAHRQVYEQVGFYNTDLSNAADYELMLRILLKYEHNACYLPEVLVKMRLGGYSNSSWKNRLRANREDHRAWKINDLQPHLFTRYLKPLRKLPQFFVR